MLNITPGLYYTCTLVDMQPENGRDRGDAHTKNLDRIRRSGTKAFVEGTRLRRTKTGSR